MPRSLNPNSNSIGVHDSQYLDEHFPGDWEIPPQAGFVPLDGDSLTLHQKRHLLAVDPLHKDRHVSTNQHTISDFSEQNQHFHPFVK